MKRSLQWLADLVPLSQRGLTAAKMRKYAKEEFVDYPPINSDYSQYKWSLRKRAERRYMTGLVRSLISKQYAVSTGAVWSINKRAAQHIQALMKGQK